MGGRGEWTREKIQIEIEPEFEYDPQKSASNKEKHGIDFEEAKILWNDKRGIRSLSKVSDELRYILISKHNEKMYTAIYTMRNDKIRIISVRRSRKQEVSDYEQRD
jgi:uncharacterized DUF497 family protein